MEQFPNFEEQYFITETKHNSIFFYYYSIFLIRIDFGENCSFDTTDTMSLNLIEVRTEQCPYDLRGKGIFHFVKPILKIFSRKSVLMFLKVCFVPVFPKLVTNV